MRIAIYWHQESWGGVDTHLQNLLESWPDKKDDFVLFVNDDNEGFKRIQHALEREKNVRCVTFKNVAFWRSSTFSHPWKKFIFFNKTPPMLYPIYWLFLRIQARKLFTQHGPFDALIAENGGYPAAWGCLAAIVEAFKSRIPKRILVVHHAATAIRSMRKLIEDYIDKQVQLSATDIVTVSNATKDELLKLRNISLRRGTVKVIYNGIKVDCDEKDILDLSRNEPFNMSEKNIIGMIGRIEAYKGHDDLLAAFSLLDDELKANSRIVIVGRGEESEINRLRSLIREYDIEEKVIFTSYLKGSSLAIIAQFDVLVSATKDFEGFGLTVLEAMAIGVPVIATNVGAISEIILDGKVGILIPPENRGELARALTVILANQSFREQIISNAKKRAEIFTAIKMASEFKNVVNSQNELLT